MAHVHRTRVSQVLVAIRRWGFHRAVDLRLRVLNDAGEWTGTVRGFGLTTRGQIDELVAALAQARLELPE